MGICGSRHIVVNDVVDAQSEARKSNHEVAPVPPQIKSQHISIQNIISGRAHAHSEEKISSSPARYGWMDKERSKSRSHNQDDEVQAFDDDEGTAENKSQPPPPNTSRPGSTKSRSKSNTGASLAKTAGLSARIFGGGSSTAGVGGASSPGPPKAKKGGGGEAWKPLRQSTASDEVEQFDAPLSPIVPPSLKTNSIINKACFGAGCYWGTEHYLRQRFGEHIVKGAVGFMGPQGSPANPSYEDVCNGGTGHVEVFDIEFKGGVEVFKDMCRYFFQMHDPTTLNRQGNDRGTQYASIIYAQNDEAFEVATAIRDEVQKLVNSKKITCYQSVRISTVIRMRTIFYKAKEEHQLYLDHHPDGYCNHRIRFSEWPVASS